jgi:hypothetical protein
MERRFRRSDRIETALEYQLQACTERAGLRAMVLADHDGLLVASSPWSEERVEELAAIMPLLAKGDDFSGVVATEEDRSDPVLVSSFVAAGAPLFLCAVGDYGSESHHEIARAKVGVRRILN